MTYTEQKEMLQDKNCFVTRPIPKLPSDIVARKGTRVRSKRYTPVKMKNLINKYFEWCEKEDEVPSIKGMMIHINMLKDMFYKYLEYPEYNNMLEHARMIIAHWAENDVYRTKGLAAGKIAYMKNIHGWSDKLETNNYTETKVITVDEARSKIEMLAPKLLEILKNSTVLNQITHREIKDAEVIEYSSESRRI